ncbi:MAG: chemotaxis protein CheX [Planctomycetales bacterium]|nr:chemotaxis protein CheX [Planctomycetales bacterium]
MNINSEQLAELTRNVCQAMLGLDITPSPSPASSETQLTSKVCISGQWNRTIEVVASPEAARCLAATMFCMDPSEVAASEIEDAVSEVANMIGGNVKGILGGDCELSLPSIESQSSVTLETEPIAKATFDLDNGVLQVLLKHS